MKRNEFTAAVVAGAAFLGSAQHITEVTIEAGNHPAIALLHPLALDGLIYIGIHAALGGRRAAGIFTISVGALYSLAFNAASYGEFVMPGWALAACLPFAMVLSFIMVHGRTVDVEADMSAGADAPGLYSQTLDTAGAATLPGPAETLPPLPPTSTGLVPSPVDVDKSTGRVRMFDVDKAVDMLLVNESTGRVCEVTGASPKTVQRVRRVLTAVRSGQLDESIVSPGNITPALVRSVRTAYERSQS